MGTLIARIGFLLRGSIRVTPRVLHRGPEQLEEVLSPKPYYTITMRNPEDSYWYGKKWQGFGFRVRIWGLGSGGMGV